LFVREDFHTKLKHKEQIKDNANLTEEQKHITLKKIDEELEEIGGMETYQQASLFGEQRKKFSSFKWVLKVLKQRNVRPIAEYRKLRLLDVGAITLHYKGISWLDVMAIDINPLDQYVLKQDFFELEEPQGSFDVIILSLVLNFVGDIRKRGLMLKKCQILLREKDHSNPQDLGGLLFLVLPLACTANSRYLTQELLLEILEALGFKLLEHKDSPKLTFFVLQLVKKKVYRYGKRNNFCILLSKDD